MGEAGKLGRFGLVFLDPPYGKGLGEKALASLVVGGWLEQNAAIVLEDRAGLEIAVPEGLQMTRQREFGETQVIFLAPKPAMG
jgi:16S rRNA (guanine966-N2)-methyltransferase